MKKGIIGSGVFLVLLGGWYWLEKNKPYDETFLIPRDYRGCVSVVYDIQGVPELTVEDHTIIYTIEKDGILLTSSPDDFGWEGKENSGPHHINYFYVDENSNEVNEIPENLIGPVVLGEYSENGRVLIKRLTFPINDQNASCDNNFEELNKKVDEKLIIN